MDNRKPALKSADQHTRLEQPATRPLRIKTAIRAGDIYMQNPRGSNNPIRP